MDEDFEEATEHGEPEEGSRSAGRPRRAMRSTSAESGPLIAAAVVRIGSSIRPGTRSGEGWPRQRAGVALQMVSIPGRAHHAGREPGAGGETREVTSETLSGRDPLAARDPLSRHGGPMPGDTTHRDTA